MEDAPRNEERRLLTVHAHPDDESITTGGLLARCSAAGIHTCLITCTDGRYGPVNPELGLTLAPEDLAQARTSELRVTGSPGADASVRAAVGRTHERVHITKNGKDYVVLLAAEDLESIEATLELLSDPASQERIAQSPDEIARGEGLSIAEVARSLDERFGKRRP